MTNPVPESPGRYTKKPVTIEAMQFTDNILAVRAVTDWMEENGYPWLVGNALDPDSLRLRGREDDEMKPTSGMWIDPATGALMIRTLEGDMRVSFGDYVIQGIQGEFYPCKPDIFAATYGPARPAGVTDPFIPESLLAELQKSHSNVRLAQRSLTITTVNDGYSPFPEVERPKFIVTSEVEVYATLDTTKSARTEPHILIQNGKPLG